MNMRRPGRTNPSQQIHGVGSAIGTTDFDSKTLPDEVDEIVAIWAARHWYREVLRVYLWHP